MGSSRSERRSCIFSRVLLGSALFVLVVVVARSTVARAEPLDEVAGTASEITAPATEVVETVVPPPASQPPAAPAPEPAVQVPEVGVAGVSVKPSPVKLPGGSAKLPSPDGSSGASVPSPPKVAETAASTVEASTEAVTEAAGSAQSTASGATDAARETATSATAPVEATLGQDQPRASDSSSRARGSIAENGSVTTLSNAAGTTLGADDGVGEVARLPARLLDPFIRVWPAVALTAERSLGNFVGHWSRSMLALFEEHGIGSLRGEAGAGGGDAVGALADSTPASHSSDQPPFSWLTPRVPPFRWLTSESALASLFLFIAIATATLGLLALGRRELGLPIFRRRTRIPWKH
jgi:hypothetical protein